MSPGTDVAQRTPAQDLVAQVRDPRVKEQLAMALPPTVTVDRFVRVMTAAIMTNPDIAKLDHQSILTALVRAAADGLIPDGKEAAIVGRGGKATYQPMVGGFRKIAAEHGWTLRGYPVFEADEFEHRNIIELPIHQPARPGVDRGAMIAAWAVATHRDGRREFRVMYADEIAKRRALATTQNVWEKWPAEMATKTVVRDLFADLPLADSDLVARVLGADIDPDEATATLYGPREIAATTETAAAAAASPGNGGEISQQAGDAHPPRDGTPRAEEASPAPGGDEPDLGEPRPAQLNDDEQAAIEAAAQQAAMFVPPSEKTHGMTISEIYATPERGRDWLLYTLRKTDLRYSNEVWAFARLYAPELYHQVLAEREAAA